MTRNIIVSYCYDYDDATFLKAATKDNWRDVRLMGSHSVACHRKEGQHQGFASTLASNGRACRPCFGYVLLLFVVLSIFIETGFAKDWNIFRCNKYYPWFVMYRVLDTKEYIEYSLPIIKSLKQLIKLYYI